MSKTIRAVITWNAILFILMFFNASAQHIKNLNMKTLPSLPIQGGISAPFVGVNHGHLIVVGGCNFPNLPAVEGGKKEFYNNVFSLDLSCENAEWQSCKTFPLTVAYGAYYSTSKGIICIGGENHDGVLDQVYLVQFDSLKKDVFIQQLANLPVAISNGSADCIGDTLFVSGCANGTTYLFGFNLLDLNEKWVEYTTISTERQQSILLSYKNNLYLFGGYDANNAYIFKNVLRYDFINKTWVEFDSSVSVALVGSSAVKTHLNDILFFGGVNYDRFQMALNRIQRTKQAVLSDDIAKQKLLKIEAKEYMSQKISWYQFNDVILSYSIDKKNWMRFDSYPQTARAGAGVVMHKNQIYIICGELKPGIRTNEVNCLTIKLQND